MELDQRPIPLLSQYLHKQSYHSIAIDAKDPRATENLVDVRDAGLAAVPFYNLADGTNAPYHKRIEGSISEVLCRERLVSMLCRVNKRLAPYESEVLILDAYRPIAVQHGLWQWALEKVSSEFPHLSQVEIENKTRIYSSDPRRFRETDPSTWPIHTSGASIDLVLRCTRTGCLLDMGAAFDELGAVSHTDHYERLLSKGNIGESCPALVNRRILYWSMIDEGFVNYPAEYWHFDFGNQMYVLNARALGRRYDSAWYGYCAQ